MTFSMVMLVTLDCRIAHSLKSERAAVRRPELHTAGCGAATGTRHHGAWRCNLQRVGTSRGRESISTAIESDRLDDVFVVEIDSRPPRAAARTARRHRRFQNTTSLGTIAHPQGRI